MSHKREATPDPESDQRSLGSSVRRVASASAVALLIGESVSFGQTIALARILSPAEIGLFAAGTVLTMFLGNFVEGGLRSGLIQRKADLADAAETVFWVTLMAGTAMALAALAIAPLIGHVFGSDIVTAIAAASSGLLVLHGLMNVPEAMLQRAFSVRRRLVVGPLVSITFAAVSIPLAATGWGVWAMVAGIYASQAAALVALWLLVGWRPRRGRASFRLWRELARYGFPLVLGLLSARARTLAEAFLVGRWLSPSSLGYFRYAQRIARVPTTAIIEIGSNSLFPAFSRIAGDRDRMLDLYTRALHWSMVAAAATTGLMLALGEPAVVVVFGEPWRNAGVALQAMSGIGVGYAMTCVSEEAIKGAGRTALLNWLTALDLILGVGVLGAFVFWGGLIGASLSLSVTSVTIGLVMIALARKVVVVPLRQLASALMSPLPALAIAAGTTWALDHYVMRTESRTLPLAVACLVLDVLVYSIIYLLVLSVFARPSVKTILGIGRTALRKVSDRSRTVASDADRHSAGDA
jgi:O-antigen/teichoic acid export membrane protein